ncbi:MAG: hypothetical protein A3G35_14725 [candidate division NC10 bacterium RIFCSPLOWO2_12_FULL_66_18]|nr:MAG: hypothetical protein A3G35_14725 [candidate division NC10 bacterium RIFCSPLOWO2_12_FULL_66_18]
MIPQARPLAGAAPLLLLAGLLVAACAVVPEPPRPAPSGLTDRPDTLLDRLAADEAAVITLRGLASVRYDGPAGSGSGTQVIVVALPDRARLEALSPMGTAVLILAIRGDLLTAHAPTQHEYAVGRATRETLGRLARLSIPPGPLLRLLVGLPPLPIRPGDPRVRVTVEAASIRVESVDGAFWQRMWMGPDGAWVERGELGEAAGLLLRFQFGERRRLDGATVPFGLQLEEVTAGTTLVIRYETVRLNEPVESWLFELPRPADGRTRILDLGGGPPP